MTKHILFICTGNTCRSPMAEGIFRDMVKKEGLQVEARSAGVSAFDGSPIAHHSAEILRKKGIRETLASNAIKPEWVEWADLILTMTMNHKQQLIQMYPDGLDKVFTLKEYIEDEPLVLALLEERNRLISEIQIKRALSQPVSAEELARLQELDLLSPDYDISDPFGGTLEDYRYCADDIEASLKKLLAKIKGNSAV